MHQSPQGQEGLCQHNCETKDVQVNAFLLECTPMVVEVEDAHVTRILISGGVSLNLSSETERNLGT